MDGKRTYRIDFALMVLTGNLTRYLITRPLVEQDPEVISRWYPIRTWVPNDPLRFLPGMARIRLRHVLDSWPLYVRRPPDAAVIHAFEPYYLFALMKRVLRRRRCRLIYNPDGYFPLNKAYRLAAEETDLFVPWSNFFAEDIRRKLPDVSNDRIVVLHPGIDLERWPMRPPRTPEGRFRVLFVGGDIARKGGDVLVEAFEKELSKTCDLTVATQSAWLPAELKMRIEALPCATLRLDLQARSPELQSLFVESDCFVLPTTGDSSSWVGLESLCTGLPVAITPMAGIPDIIVDGETGLHLRDHTPEALIESVSLLRDDAPLRERLIRHGRAHVEANFNARTNTRKLLDLVKALVDRPL